MFHLLSHTSDFNGLNLRPTRKDSTKDLRYVVSFFLFSLFSRMLLKSDVSQDQISS